MLPKLLFPETPRGEIPVQQFLGILVMLLYNFMFFTKLVLHYILRFIGNFFRILKGCQKYLQVTPLLPPSLLFFQFRVTVSLGQCFPTQSLGTLRYCSPCFCYRLLGRSKNMHCGGPREPDWETLTYLVLGCSVPVCRFPCLDTPLITISN